MLAHRQGKLLSEAEAAKYLTELVRTAVFPHVERVAEITLEGRIAVVVHEVHPDVYATLRALGWDGHAPLFGVSRRIAKGVAASCRRNGDEITARWLLRDGAACSRVWLFDGAGNVLLNFDRVRREWSVEPGSTSTPSSAN